MTDTVRNKLDKIFSEFIRLRDNGKCYTCPARGRIQDMDAGHYVDRGNMSTRYDEMNVHCQCHGCNRQMNKKEMREIYARRLDKEYGKGTAEMLDQKGRKIQRYTDYVYWIPVYKEKVKELQHVQLSKASL